MAHQARSLKIISLITSLSILFGLLVIPTNNVNAALTLGDLIITPLTWNVIGLDSNDPTVGPDTFPVGARLCNNGDSPALNVQAAFVWDGSHDYVDLRSGSYGTGSNPYPVVPLISNVAPDNCHDFYFEVVIDRTPAAFDSTAGYHIELNIPGLGTLSTPTPRELYVERLISQSRNATYQVYLDGKLIPPGGTLPLMIGGTYDIRLVGYTATGGYEQIESYINFPNTIFSINSVSTSHSTINDLTPDSLAASRLYADGCTWENNPDSPNYRSCLGTGKYGNVVTVNYNVTIIGGAGSVQELTNLIYDFSGSSYHYNADYPTNTRIAAIIDPSNVSITKTFVPDSITPGQTSILTIRVTNPNGGELTGVNFTDPLPSPLTATGTAPLLFNCGTGATLTGTTTLVFSNGTLAANSTCVIRVEVTASTIGTYPNTTTDLWVEGINTGETASDDLVVADQVQSCTSETMANWTVPATTSNPPDTATPVAGSPTIKSVIVGNPQALGVGGTFTLETVAITDGHQWAGAGFPTGTARDPSRYFQFTVDTTKYRDISWSFTAGRKNNGPDSFVIYYVPNGGSEIQIGGVFSIPSVSTGYTFSNTVGTGYLPSGNTTFRIYPYHAGNNGNDAKYLLDNILFTGTICYPPPPRISKSFSPDPIAVGSVSTLTFTITNDKPFNEALTGITFSDVLPVGLTVSSATTSVCNGGTLSVTAPRTINLAGASLAAGGSCTFSVPVTGIAPGYYDNISGVIDSNESDANTGADGTATDTLLVLSPPSIEKDFAISPIVTGSSTTLRFTITNPNPTAVLHGVAFSDNLPAGVTVASSSSTQCSTGTLTTTSPATITLINGTLAAAESCSFDITVTGFTEGTWLNETNNVTSTDGGTGNTATDEIIVRDPLPAISLLKQVGLTASGPWYSFVAVDPPLPRDVYFHFIVENTGDTVFTNVSITDVSLPGLDLSNCTAVLAGNLAMYETKECTSGPQSVTLPGDYTNTAYATGNGTDSDPDEARYATTGLSIDKSVTEPFYLAIGDILHYSFLVTNSGDAPLVGPVVVMDDLAGDETCPPVNTVGDLDAYLDPDESIICTATYTIQASDITLPAGSVTNIAQAIAGGVTSNTDTETVPQFVPALTTDKVYVDYTDNDSSGSITSGDDLNYTVTMTNTGNTTLTNVVVSDPELTPTSQTCASVAPGGTCVLTGSYTVLQSDVDAGSFENTGSVTDDDVCTTAPYPVECSDTETVLIPQTYTLTTDKVYVDYTDNDSSGSITAGDELNYTVTMTNTGTTTLTNVVVSDPELTPTSQTCASVAPGGTCVLTGSYTVLQSDVDAGSFENTGSVTDDDVCTTAPYPVECSDTETVLIPQTDALTTDKAYVDYTDNDSSGSITAGDDLSYTVTMTNTGTTTLTNVVVSDPELTPTSQTCASVAPGGTCVLTGSYTVLQSDVDAGSFENTGSVTDDDVCTVTGDPACEDTVVITFPQTPDLTIDKVETSTGPYVLGNTITYNIVVTNTGNVTLTNVTVADSAAVLGTCVPVNGSDLAPLATMTCAATHVVTQADVDAGSFTNVGSVTDDDVCTVTGDPACEDTVVITFPQTPDIDIRKNIEGPDSQVISFGNDAIFTIRVTNTGNVTLDIVSVTDPLVPDCAATGLGPILPGGYVEYLCTVLNVTIGFTNTATTQGETTTGTTVTDSDDSTVLIAAVGDLSLTKALVDTNQEFTDDNNVAIGEIITYDVSVVVPPGSFSTAILTDTMDRGLAFVECTGITGPGLTTSIGTLTDVCSNAVGMTYLPSSTDPRDNGRQAVFEFGTLTNPTASEVILLVSYDAVVLNSLGNTNGLDLGNQAILTWGATDSAGPASAEDVNIVEPRLAVTKTASPTLVTIGTEVTFTLTLTHDSLFSTTDAFNVELIDQLPVELGNVTALNCTTGAQDPSTCTYSLATNTVRAVWPVFTRTGGNSVVTFRAVVLSLPPSNEITNSVTGEWTSLPDDIFEPQTIYNDLSDERTFPPGIDVDNYIDTDEIILRPAEQPSTGFAPGRITPLDITTRTVYESLDDLSIEVPNMGIVLPVVGVPLSERSWNLTWLWGQAGWLEETAYPTWHGNSVITAHVYLPNGKPGPFLNLGKLAWGDQIIIHTNGLRYVYQVRSVTTVNADNMSAFKHEDKAWITLVTCKEFDAKTDTYKKRIVVKAILVDVTDELSNSK
jgi:LPXTG-site transpeptidase (sortase) family protein